MKKYYIYVFLFVVATGFAKANRNGSYSLKPSTIAYPNYSVALTTADLIWGTGNVTGSITINNNVLNLTFNGTWSPQQMKLGVIKHIAINEVIPYIDLGVILDPAGNNTGYRARIENNDLIFYSPLFVDTILSQNALPDARTYFDSTFQGLGYENDTWGYSFPIVVPQNATSTGSCQLTLTQNRDSVTFNLYMEASGANLTRDLTGQQYHFDFGGTILPDTELGYIAIDNQGTPSPVKAKIENNWLVFYSDGLASLPTGCTFTYSYDLLNEHPLTWYQDKDNDGYGNNSVSVYGDYPVSSYAYVTTPGDCDDTNAAINPDTRWYQDANNDGEIDANELLTFLINCSSPGVSYTNSPNYQLNWTHSIAYDIKGNTVGSSRTYFDELGKPTETLSRDFKTNIVWGSEVLYDDYQRKSKESFIAPAPSQLFERVDFFKKATGQAIPIVADININQPVTLSQSFEATNTITASSIISLGLNVAFKANEIRLLPGFNATAGFQASLGTASQNVVSNAVSTYYSDSNTLEPYQATAQQPYSEINYDNTLNPGNVINVVGGNKIDDGSGTPQWKTGYSYTVPAAQEMYYVYGYNYYDGAIASGKEEVITKFFKSISVDAHGVENVAFSDGEGKTLAVARSGGPTNYPVYSLIGTQGYVDVHIPAGTPDGTLLGAVSNYKIYNLKTGLPHTSSTLPSGNAYRVEAVTIPTADPKLYIDQTPTGGTITYQPVTALGVAYNVNYYDYSVNVYNKTGQLIKNVQPNGYQANTVIKDVPAHMLSSATSFISTYTYNDQGQIKEAKSPDEGTSKFAYRNDGQIRYSQSEIQAQVKINGVLQNSEKVSYTNYDELARPIESGVITSTPGLWATAVANPDGNLVAGTPSEQTGTIYDYDGNNTTSIVIPASLSLSSVLTAAGLNPANYVQENLAGNVVCTFTKQGATINAITWYNYDAYGRVVWVVQYNDGLGAKTIHYEYDYKGNVKKVLYQKDKPTELFVHQYTYSLKNELTKVETSINNSTFITHAEYDYYLTGQLKRTNIAQGAQGIDYVYTLGGQLKSINHPSLEQAKDPGHDANDVFGITLDYYNGDYLRANTNIASSPTIAGTNQDFNGNIKATRWANKNDIIAGTTNQRAYLYDYNRNGWMTDATFGSTNNTGAITPASMFKEGALTYDANGNIKTLQRTNDTGQVIDQLSYNYNSNNQLNNVADGVTPSTVNYDIDSQANNNYEYNAIGQLWKNNSEGLEYFYNTQGLTTEVQKNGHTAVKFFYNERGQRVKKESYNTSTWALQSTDYYALDISGNAMAIYTQAPGGNPVETELPIYGASRLGVYYKTATPTSDYMQYQITDHLGNVRAIIKKMANGNPIVAIFVSDYYPFGEKLPSRDNITGQYRYAYQGQELDGETGMEAFQLRLWDGRIGRWLNPDPMGQYASPYLGMGNNPVSFVDPDGGWDGDPPTDGSCGNGDTWNDGVNSWTNKNGVWYNDMTGLGLLNEIVVVAVKHKNPLFNFKLNWDKAWSDGDGLSFGGKLNLDFTHKNTNLAERIMNPDRSNIKGYDFEAAVATLNANANINSLGKCAKYVRLALEGGGLSTAGRPVSAKNYDSFLPKLGFKEVGVINYQPITGDIVVIQSFGTHIHGHIMMYNGKNWISDFKQKGFWPGSSYRLNKPDYKVFR